MFTGQPALSMFAPSGQYVLDEHKRAEIAGRYSSANLDSRFKCSYASLAREYGVSKSTITYICNEQAYNVAKFDRAFWQTGTAGHN